MEWNVVHKDTVPNFLRVIVGNSKTKKVEIRYYNNDENGWFNNDSEDYEPFDWYDRFMYLPERSL